MARTRTLAQMRTEVRRRADVENSLHVTDAEITELLNEGLSELYGEISQRAEGDYVNSYSINTVAGTEEYALHAKFWRLASIPPHATIGGRVVTLRRWQATERAPLLDPTTGWDSGRPVYYRLTAGDMISFLPKPDAVYTVTVWYVPALTLLAADGDTFDGRNGWETWAVLYAAAQVGIKEESDVRALVAERDRLRTQIVAEAGAKDMAEPARVQDVEADERWRRWPRWGW